MSNNPNTLIARRYFEDIWNKGDQAVVSQIVADDAVGHASGLTLHGADALRQRVSTTRAAYPNLRFDVQDIFGADDKVLARWAFSGTHSGEYMGYPGTGRTVNVTGMNVFRIVSGKIVELWTNGDDLGELQQLGIIPALA